MRRWMRTMPAAAVTSLAVMAHGAYAVPSSDLVDGLFGLSSPYVCQIEKGVYPTDLGAREATYKAAGSCARDGMLVGRWQAKGTFSPATGAATESISIVPAAAVRGNINTLGAGQVYTTMTCSTDPWLNDAVNCNNGTANAGDAQMKQIAISFYGPLRTLRPATSSGLSATARATLAQAIRQAGTIPAMGVVHPKGSTDPKASTPGTPAAAAATTTATANDPLATTRAAPGSSLGGVSAAAAAKANVLAEIGRTSQASSRPAQSAAAAASVPSPAASGMAAKLPTATTAAAKANVGSALDSGSSLDMAQLQNKMSERATATQMATGVVGKFDAAAGSVAGNMGGGGGGSRVPAPAATPTVPAGPSDTLATLVRTSDLPGDLARLNDNAIIIVGGKQVRAADVKREVLHFDDRAIIIVGGRKVAAASVKQELAQSQPDSARAQTPKWGEVPGQKVTLNPQPLPPRQPLQATPNPAFGAPASALQR